MENVQDVKKEEKLLGNKIPKVGDVLMSEQFAFGHIDNESNDKVDVIHIHDGKNKMYYEEEELDEEERIEIALKTGKRPPKKRRIQLGRYDESRAKAKFVVETRLLHP